jgi:hypothetical protein
MLGYELRGWIACAARREASDNCSDQERDAHHVIHRYLPMRAPPPFLLGSKSFLPTRLFTSQHRCRNRHGSELEVMSAFGP